jgi:ribosome biogenesis ATPase
MIDPAMVRPGRLDKLLYVDLPREDERVEIVRTMVRKVPLGEGQDGAKAVMEGVETLVRERCEGYSGADLAAVVREAGATALRKRLGVLDEMNGNTEDGEPVRVRVGVQDFVRALDKVGPSVSVVQRRKYEGLRSKFAGLPVGSRKDEEKEKFS